MAAVGAAGKDSSQNVGEFATCCADSSACSAGRGRRTMQTKEEVLAAMRAEIGKESEPGEWFVVDQPLIDRYCAISGEDVWIHVDPERAKLSTWLMAITRHLSGDSLVSSISS